MKHATIQPVQSSDIEAPCAKWLLKEGLLPATRQQREEFRLVVESTHNEIVQSQCGDTPIAPGPALEGRAFHLPKEPESLGETIHRTGPHLPLTIADREAGRAFQSGKQACEAFPQILAEFSSCPDVNSKPLGGNSERSVRSV